MRSPWSPGSAGVTRESVRATGVAVSSPTESVRFKPDQDGAGTVPERMPVASQTPGGRSQGAIDVFHFLGGPPAPGAQGCKLRVKGSLKADKPKVQRSSQAGTCVSMSSHCHVEEPTLEGTPGCSDSWLGSPFVALPAGRQHHSGPLSALQPRGPGRLARAAQREAEPARGPQGSAPAHLSEQSPPHPGPTPACRPNPVYR